MRLRYFDTLDQLTDALKLRGIRCNDVFGVLGHLLFHELKKAGDDWVALVAFGLPLSNSLCRHQDGTICHHCHFDLAFKLGVRFKKPRRQTHATRIADLHNGALILLLMLCRGHMILFENLCSQV